jgi:hypothetical protein
MHAFENIFDSSYAAQYRWNKRICSARNFESCSSFYILL